MRAAIYVRVSKEEQARHGVSLDAQAESCTAYCTLKRFTITRVLRDEGVTSGIPLAQRPAGRELCGLIERGEVEHVIVYSLSRVFRDAVEALTTSRQWDAIGVSLHMLDVGGQAIDTSTAIGRFFFSVMAGAAELERNLLRERVTAAMDHIADTGRKPAGIVYGYARRDKALVPDSAEAEIVREVFRRIGRGEALATVAKDLTERGVPCKQAGRYWDNVRLAAMVRNQVYLGKVNWRGEVLPGTHEPIITRAVWNKANQVLDGRAQNRGRSAKRWSSIFRCGHCGGRVRSHRQSRKGGKPLNILECIPLAMRETQHEGNRLAEQKAMAAVWRHTELLLTDGALRDAVSAAKQALARGRADVRGVEQRLDEIGEQRRRNGEAFARGLVTVADLEALNAPLVAEEHRLLARLAETQEPAALAELEKLVGGDVGAVVQRVRDTVSVDEQVRFLRALYERVEYFRDRLVFHVRGGILPPTERQLPGYYDPSRGSDIGF